MKENNVVYVGIDIGGSKTRLSFLDIDISFPTIYGKGLQREVYSENLDSGYSEFSVKKDDEEKLFILKEDALDMYKCEKVMLTHLSDKYKQLIYRVNILYSIVKLYFDYNIRPESIRFVFTLPPREVFNNAPEYLRQVLPGTYRFEFPYINDRVIEFTLKPESIIGILPEGAAARGSLSKTELSEMMGLVLITDVGRRSTDSILLNNMKALANTATSTDLGGHMLEADLLNSLRVAGITTTMDSLPEILRTGKAQGHDVTPIVVNVKRRFANQILNNIIETTSNIEEYTLQDIKTLFLVGRVFIESDNKDISLLNMIKELLPDKKIITPADQDFANSKGAKNVGSRR